MSIIASDAHMDSVLQASYGLQACGDMETLGQRLASVVDAVGYSKITMIDFRAPQPMDRYLTSVGGEFVRDYVASDAILHDPLFHKIAAASGPFNWRNDIYFAKQYVPCRHIGDMLDAANIRYGLTVPIYGPCGLRGHVTFGGDNHDTDAKAPRFGLQLLAAIAFEGAISLRAPSSQRAPVLTEREREVLLWSAEGMTAADISDRLLLSSRTVESYLRAACLKLGAVSKSHAVALAIRHRLVA
jgi:LuxR family quorum sensing-dependent transcriptional regulator